MSDNAVILKQSFKSLATINHKYYDMQDSRLVDLPLSPAFLKLLCGGEVSGMVRESSDIVTRYNPVAQNHSAKNVGAAVL